MGKKMEMRELFSRAKAAGMEAGNAAVPPVMVIEEADILGGPIPGGKRWVEPEGMADKFLRSLMAKRYEKASYEKEPRPIWELTSDLHGDIERCYWIFFGKGGLMGGNEENFSVMFASRPRSYPELGTWIESSKVRFENLAEFVAAVNRERVECNRRLAELKASSKAYADSSDYPMINLEKEVAA